VPACPAVVKAGRVHLCRVQGNTVWFNMASDMLWSSRLSWWWHTDDWYCL